MAYKPRSLYCMIASAITVAVAIALLVVGSIYIDQTLYVHNYWTQIYALSIFSVCISILAIIFGIGLIFVLYRQYPALTTLFSGLLVFVAFLGVVCAIILVVGKNNVGEKSYKNTIQLFNNYSDSAVVPNTKETVIEIQQSFKCCGVERATYWENKYSDKTSTPDSCCLKVTPGCGQGSLLVQDKIYLRGCAEPIAISLRGKYSALIGLNFTLLVLALATAILAIIFERFMRQQYETL